MDNHCVYWAMLHIMRGMKIHGFTLASNNRVCWKSWVEQVSPAGDEGSVIETECNDHTFTAMGFIPAGGSFVEGGIWNRSWESVDFL